MTEVLIIKAQGQTRLRSLRSEIVSLPKGFWLLPEVVSILTSLPINLIVNLAVLRVNYEWLRRFFPDAEHNPCGLEDRVGCEDMAAGNIARRMFHICRDLLMKLHVILHRVNEDASDHALHSA